jgi:signal transduction histidine kinase
VKLTLVRPAPAASDAIVLTIEDDGKGCDFAQTSVNALGLRGIRERVAAFGGQIVIRADTGQGTALRATIPLGETRREAA